jgi:peptidoglycan/LPS O-acetylase OafA/YrhL
VVCLAFWVAGWFLDWLNVARPVWLFHKPMPWYSYATFSQNFAMAREGGYFGANWLGVTWSLAIEEQFYLLAPITIRWIPRDRLPWVLGGVILAGILLREFSESILLYVFPHGRLTAYVMMPCRADSLALGILAAWMVRNESRLEWLRARRAMLLLSIGIGVAGLLVFIAKGWGLFSRPMSLFGFSWLAMVYGGLLLYARLFPVSMLGSVLRFRPLVQLGSISYCVYLIHQPISGLFHWLLRGGEPMIQKPSDAVVTLLALVVTLIVAKISWDHFEKPMLKLGHRHSY